MILFQNHLVDLDLHHKMLLFLSQYFFNYLFSKFLEFLDIFDYLFNFVPLTDVYEFRVSASSNSNVHNVNAIIIVSPFLTCP